MCPAFGSLRVGLRMRRTATILSGSACCVYGLTFTSHFYGAKRTVGYVPFNSETLVRGQLYEDIRNAVFETAKPADYDAVVVINLCVPTASGVPLDRLPKAIDGVRIIGIDVPGFGVPTHAEAKDVLAGAMLRYARLEAEAGPVARPRALAELPTVTLIGELFPADPVGVGALLAPMGLAVGPQVPSREWRDLYGALDCAVAAAVHPFYTASIREMQAAGRPVVGSGPVGVDGTAAWLDAIGTADTACSASMPPRPRRCRRSEPRMEANPINARITVSGYEGSELLVARLLIEAGAEVPYVGTACPKTRMERSRPRLAGSSRHARAVPRLAGAGLSRRCRTCGRILRSARRRWCRRPRRLASRRCTSPTWFPPGRCSVPAGAGALAAIVAAQTKGRERFARMVSFFDKVGVGETAGYGWTRHSRRIRRDRRTATARPARRRPRQPRRWGPDACSFWITTEQADTGARFTPSPRSAACA